MLRTRSKCSALREAGFSINLHPSDDEIPVGSAMTGHDVSFMENKPHVREKLFVLIVLCSSLWETTE